MHASDIDGDSDTDLLSASEDDSTIAWHENDGSPGSGFTIHMITTDANEPKGLYSADVDGDGATDVLSAAGNGIVWYENDGAENPSFTERVLATPRLPNDVHAVDIDGDSDTDVLAASEFDDNIVWYENDGAEDPSFTAHTITTNADGAVSVFAADLDRDDDTDVLSASDNGIEWYENDGTNNPNFTARTITTNASGAIYAADVNGDDDPDVVSASFSDDKIAWYKNDGAGDPSFTAHTITTNANGAESVYATDLDGGNDTDILSASEFDNKIAWYENDGANNPSFTAHAITTNAHKAESVYAADINGDNAPDVLSASYRDDKIGWYENDGASDPSFAIHKIKTGASAAFDVYASDMDGDSDTDVLSASRFDNRIAWYEHDGSPSDGGWTTHTITTSATDARSVHAADVDGDNDTDALSASRFGDEVAWYENDGTENPSFTKRVISTPQTPNDVYAADVDGDNDTDILSASDNIAWHENDGTNNPNFTEHVIETSTNNSWSIYAADVDGDNDTDIVSTSWGTNNILWYENDGTDDPSFTTHTVTTSAESAWSVHAADVDGDSDTDILSGSADDNVVAWYENDGTDDPDFTKRAISADFDNSQALSVYATDVDKDSDTDVLASVDYYDSSTSDYESKIVWYKSDGAVDPSFTEKVITKKVDVSYSVHAADVDGDSNTDILSTSRNDDQIAWYQNGSGAPLPVDLADLTVRSVDQTAQLTWKTTSETGNAGFYIQHQGTSQPDWTQLDFVDGAGTTSETQSYRFRTEQELGPGTHRFRLRQVDTDGTEHFSKTVSVRIKMQQKARLSAPAPNPVTEKARLTFAVRESKETRITLYNVLGQQVATLYEGKPASEKQIRIDLDASELASGTYLVRLQTGGTTKTQKLTVVR